MLLLNSTLHKKLRLQKMSILLNENYITGPVLMYQLGLKVKELYNLTLFY